MPASLPSIDLARADLARLQADGLSSLLTEILPHNRFYARKFAEAGLSLSRLSFPQDLASLPFTTKAELLASQQAKPPFGEMFTPSRYRYVRLHQTSGTAGRPLRWFDTAESWSMLLDCWLDYFRMGGIHQDDRLFFPFSFGPFLGFWTAFEAGLRFGCLCLPGGGMSSTARCAFCSTTRSRSFSVRPPTPSACSKWRHRKESICVLQTCAPIIVAGEAGGSISATRQRIEAGWGARVFDHNGMTETGPMGFECQEAPGGLHLMEPVCWPEVLDPTTMQQACCAPAPHRRTRC